MKCGEQGTLGGLIVPQRRVWPFDCRSSGDLESFKGDHVCIMSVFREGTKRGEWSGLYGVWRGAPRAGGRLCSSWDGAEYLGSHGMVGGVVEGEP